MPTLRTYYLFISHAWTRKPEYIRLVNMLDAAPRFQWRNYSVPVADPLHANSRRALERELDDQIRPTQAVLIISGMYVNLRDWIQYEIDKAVEWEKPIIGIIPRGNERLPREVTDVAAEMVGWNTNSIVSAIRRHATRRSAT